MRRRSLLFALPQVAAASPQLPDPNDPWNRLAEAWNPFANSLNGGILDLRLWKKVVKEFHRIEGECK